MLTQESCPQCGREADSSRVRLVQDSCGHRKCRECLVNEEAGCLLCSCTPMYTELRPAAPDLSQCDGPELFATASDSSAVTGSVASSTTSGSASVNELVSSIHQQESLLSTCPSDLSSEKEDVEQAVEATKVSNISERKAAKKQPTFGLKDHIVFTPGNPPKYFCKKCKKSYNNRKAARYHNYCGASSNEKPHTCDECGQGFVTKGHLEYHMKSHTGSLPFTCKSCNKGFKQLSKLNRHSKSHEGASEKSFRCNLCEKSLSTKQNLNDHMLSHSKGHFVTCPICNKKLSSQSCLRKHKKLHADPVHKCRDCGKTFPVKWSLDVHLKSHQRERKFKCKLCNRAFKIQGDLKRHAVVHQEDGEWECKICQLIFRRRDNLVRHMKNIHPLSPQVVFSKQGNEMEQKVDITGKYLEDTAKSLISTSNPNAVSVIRGLAVPVIQKAETKVANSNIFQSTSSLEGTSNNPDKERSTQTTCNEELNDHFSDSAAYAQPSWHQAVAGMDQNFHRESVVRHSDGRGVVHYGSSSLESVCYLKTKAHESSIGVPYSDQFQVFETNSSIVPNENRVIQSNAVERPRVIVAKALSHL